MSHIEKLMHTIREKDIPTEEVYSVVAWAFEALEKSNVRLYHEAEEKLTKLAYSITLPEAEKIVREMHPKGQMWSYDQIKQFVHSKGITEDCTNWYLVMNMCYNDYYNTAKAFGFAGDAEFYFSLARDFIEDPDAEPFKVEKYFTH